MNKLDTWQVTPYTKRVLSDSVYYKGGGTANEERVPINYKDIWLELVNIPTTPPTRSAWPGTHDSGDIVSGISGVSMTLVAGTTSQFKSTLDRFSQMVPAAYSNYAYKPTLTDFTGVDVPYDPVRWVADGINKVIEFFDTDYLSTLTAPFTLSYWQYIGPTGAAGDIIHNEGTGIQIKDETNSSSSAVYLRSLIAGVGISVSTTTTTATDDAILIAINPDPPSANIDYYVDYINGIDNQNRTGGSAEPFKTIDYAIDRVQQSGWDNTASITIVGEYPIGVTDELNLNPGSRGEQKFPLVIQGELGTNVNVSLSNVSNAYSLPDSTTIQKYTLSAPTTFSEGTYLATSNVLYDPSAQVSIPDSESFYPSFLVGYVNTNSVEFTSAITSEVAGAANSNGIPTQLGIRQLTSTLNFDGSTTITCANKSIVFRNIIFNLDNTSGSNTNCQLEFADGHFLIQGVCTQVAADIVGGIIFNTIVTIGLAMVNTTYPILTTSGLHIDTRNTGSTMLLASYTDNSSIYGLSSNGDSNLGNITISGSASLTSCNILSAGQILNPAVVSYTHIQTNDATGNGLYLQNSDFSIGNITVTYGGSTSTGSVLTIENAETHIMDNIYVLGNNNDFAFTIRNAAAVGSAAGKTSTVVNNYANGGSALTVNSDSHVEFALFNSTGYINCATIRTGAQLTITNTLNAIISGTSTTGSAITVMDGGILSVDTLNIDISGLTSIETAITVTNNAKINVHGDLDINYVRPGSGSGPYYVIYCYGNSQFNAAANVVIDYTYPNVGSTTNSMIKCTNNSEMNFYTLTQNFINFNTQTISNLYFFDISDNCNINISSTFSPNIDLSNGAINAGYYFLAADNCKINLSNNWLLPDSISEYATVGLISLTNGCTMNTLQIGYNSYIGGRLTDPINLVNNSNLNINGSLTLYADTNTYIINLEKSEINVVGITTLNSNSDTLTMLVAADSVVNFYDAFSASGQAAGGISSVRSRLQFSSILDYGVTNNGSYALLIDDNTQMFVNGGINCLFHNGNNSALYIHNSLVFCIADITIEKIGGSTLTSTNNACVKLDNSTLSCINLNVTTADSASTTSNSLYMGFNSSLLCKETISLLCNYLAGTSMSYGIIMGGGNKIICGNDINANSITINMTSGKSIYSLSGSNCIDLYGHLLSRLSAGVGIDIQNTVIRCKNLSITGTISSSAKNISLINFSEITARYIDVASIGGYSIYLNNSLLSSTNGCTSSASFYHIEMINHAKLYVTNELIFNNNCTTTIRASDRSEIYVDRITSGANCSNSAIYLNNSDLVCDNDILYNGVIKELYIDRASKFIANNVTLGSVQTGLVLDNASTFICTNNLTITYRSDASYCIYINNESTILVYNIISVSGDTSTTIAQRIILSYYNSTISAAGIYINSITSGDCICCIYSNINATIMSLTNRASTINSSKSLIVLDIICKFNLSSLTITDNYNYSSLYSYYLLHVTQNCDVKINTLQYTYSGGSTVLPNSLITVSNHCKINISSCTFSSVGYYSIFNISNNSEIDIYSFTTSSSSSKFYNMMLVQNNSLIKIISFNGSITLVPDNFTNYIFSCNKNSNIFIGGAITITGTNEEYQSIIKCDDNGSIYLDALLTLNGRIKNGIVTTQGSKVITNGVTVGLTTGYNSQYIISITDSYWNNYSVACTITGFNPVANTYSPIFISNSVVEGYSMSITTDSNALDLSAYNGLINCEGSNLRLSNGISLTVSGGSTTSNQICYGLTAVDSIIETSSITTTGTAVSGSNYGGTIAIGIYSDNSRINIYNNITLGFINGYGIYCINGGELLVSGTIGITVYCASPDGITFTDSNYGINLADSSLICGGTFTVGSYLSASYSYTSNGIALDNSTVRIGGDVNFSTYIRNSAINISNSNLTISGNLTNTQSVTSVDSSGKICVGCANSVFIVGGTSTITYNETSTISNTPGNLDLISLTNSSLWFGGNSTLRIYATTLSVPYCVSSGNILKCSGSIANIYGTCTIGDMTNTEAVNGLYASGGGTINCTGLSMTSTGMCSPGRILFAEMGIINVYGTSNISLTSDSVCSSECIKCDNSGIININGINDIIYESDSNYSYGIFIGGSSELNIFGLSNITRNCTNDISNDDTLIYGIFINGGKFYGAAGGNNTVEYLGTALLRMNCRVIGVFNGEYNTDYGSVTDIFTIFMRCTGNVGVFRMYGYCMYLVNSIANIGSKMTFILDGESVGLSNTYLTGDVNGNKSTINFSYGIYNDFDTIASPFNRLLECDSCTLNLGTFTELGTDYSVYINGTIAPAAGGIRALSLTNCLFNGIGKIAFTLSDDDYGIHIRNTRFSGESFDIESCLTVIYLSDNSMMTFTGANTVNLFASYGVYVERGSHYNSISDTTGAGDVGSLAGYYVQYNSRITIYYSISPITGTVNEVVLGALNTTVAGIRAGVAGSATGIHDIGVANSTGCIGMSI